jgi:hypothetical protein
MELSAIKIKLTKNSDPEMVAMLRKAYHKAHGTKGFCDPDLKIEAKG